MKKILFFICAALVAIYTDQMLSSDKLFRKQAKCTKKMKEDITRNRLNIIQAKLSELNNELELIRKNTGKKDPWQRYILEQIVNNINQLQQEQDKLVLTVQKLTRKKQKKLNQETS